MIPLTAREALDPCIGRVTAAMRSSEPAQATRGADTYAVFDEETESFLGVVTERACTQFPQRIFADLLPVRAPAPVAAETPIEAVSQRMEAEGVEALPVLDEQIAFLGVITRASLLEALLRRERGVLAESTRLHERIGRLGQAAQTLLTLVGRSSVERTLLQEGLDALALLLQARYGAIGILDDSGGLGQFLFSGLAPGEAEKIGTWPQGKGLMGVVIQEKQILRLQDLTQDPRHSGFPPGHPPMKSLLAVPIVNQGHVYGRLYLCDKRTGEPFTEADERLALSFARSLALALAHAQENAERKRAEERLAKLNECLLGFGIDPNENINRLVALCGMQLDATCALYNRLEEGKLRSVGQWNVPGDFNPVDKPDGHICYDVIRGDRSEARVIRNLPETVYAHTDPNVLRYGLKTYVGKPVSFGKAFVGSLCVLYGDDRLPSEEDLELLEIVASAIGVEEQRRRAEDALKSSEERFRELIQSLDVIVWEADAATWKFTFVSQRAEAILGYPVKQWLAEPEFWANHIHPDDRERAVTFCREATVEGRDHAFEYRALAADGRAVWLRDIVRVVKDQEGRARQLRGVMVNITVRKQAEEALLARTFQIEAVRAVSTEITRELDLPALLRLIVQRAMELVGAASGAVYFWDEAAQVLVPQAWSGLGEWMGEVRLSLGEGLAGIVAAERKGLIINEYQAWPHASPLFLERAGVTAAMAEPLQYRERLVGVIVVGSEGTGRTFAGQDRDTLALFAAQAAIAIENARLHSAAVRRGEELGALLRAGRSVMVGLDLQETLSRIVVEAAQISGSKHVKVLLVDRTAGVLRVGAVQGTAMPPGFQLPMGAGLSGLVAQRGQPVYSADSPNDPRNALFAEQDRELGLVTYLGLPIKIRDEILGVLTFNTMVPRRYSPEELTYLTSYADHAAIAIENARLFEQVCAGRERLHSLSRRLVEVQEAERHWLSRELHDEAGQALTALKVSLELMLADLPVEAGWLRQRIAEAVALADATTEQIRRLAQGLRPPALDAVGLNATLEGFCHDFARRTGLSIDYVGVEMPQLPETVKIGLYRVLQEALTNVAKHAHANRVHVAIHYEGKTLSLSVEDDGVGFDIRVTTSPSGQRTGMGLMGMRERIELLGGRLKVVSAEARGTRLTVELPLGERPDRRRRAR